MIKRYEAKITDFTQADYTKQYSLLERAIRDKIDRKKSVVQKKQSLAGYILLYRAMEELYNKKKFGINFNENGKPLCDFCFFSISHSAEMVICAVSDKPIGVDIQKTKGISPREKYRFFNDRENDYVNQEPNQLSQRYVEIFSKKEAAIKMLGKALGDAADVDTFSKEYCFDCYENGGFVISVCQKNMSSV